MSLFLGYWENLASLDTCKARFKYLRVSVSLEGSHKFRDVRANTSLVVRCVPFPNLLHNVSDEDPFSIEQDAVKWSWYLMKLSSIDESHWANIELRNSRYDGQLTLTLFEPGTWPQI